METLDTITASQRRILNEYQNVTHLDDIQEAIRLLSENNWNLESAIQHKYTRPTKIYQHTQDEDSPSSSSALLDNTNGGARVTNRPAGSRYLMWPFNLLWRLSLNIIQMAARLFYRPSITAPRRDARSEADRFLRDFEHTYGTTHPTFFEGGGYTQAITHAKKNLHYALVILCSQEHDDNDSFCRDTLTNDELLEFLRQHKVVVWGGNVRYTEAYQVSNTLQATTYPFLGIIALQNNKMAVIDRIEGPVTPATMIRRFEAVMTRIEPSLNQLRMEREQRELERRMRQDQDREYQESLARDQEKERKKENAKRELQLKEELERKKEMMQKQYIQYLVGLFENRTEATDQPTTKINFRFANGERVICPFYASDSLLSLYQFVEAYPHLNKVEPLNEPPKNYAHEFNFTIHSLFPKTIYEADDTVQIEDIKGLWPSATLIVEE